MAVVEVDVYEDDVFEEEVYADFTSDTVDRLDFLNKLIFIKDGITVCHPLDNIYKEVRTIRRLDISLQLTFNPMSQQGNEPAGTNFTPRRAVFNNGWRIGLEHSANGILDFIGEMISDDGLAGASLINLDHIPTGVSMLVNYKPATSEIVQVTSEVDVNAIATAVEAILLDDFAGVTVDLTPVTDAIAGLHDFDPATDDVAVVTDVTNSTPVDNAAIAIAVETQLADEFAAVNLNIDTIPVTAPPSAATIVAEIDASSTRLAAIDLATGTTIPAAIAPIPTTPSPTPVEIRNELDANSIKLASIDVAVKTDIPLQITNLHNFNPSVDTVLNVGTVALVDVVTLNTDMRGTNSAYTGSPPTVNEIVAGIDLSSLNINDILTAVGTTIPAQISNLHNFNPSVDTVAKVTLVDTTSVNTDMRGTDSVDLSGAASTLTLVSEMWKVDFNKRIFNKALNEITIFESDGLTAFKVFDTDAALSFMSPQ